MIHDSEKDYGSRQLGIINNARSPTDTDNQTIICATTTPG